MTTTFFGKIIGLGIGLGLTALAQSQVHVTIDGNVTFQTMHGWGGNTYGWIYNGWNGWEDERVYELAFNELGTTHLRLVTAFESWEPENDDGDPQHFNWTYFQSRFRQTDTKAQLVQGDFNMMEKIANAFKKQLLIGIWNVPDWMVSDPAQKDHRDLPYGKHAEFAESVAAYLLWARDQRGIHIPEIVLANEPDGTCLEYTPAALRDLIKTVGAKFKQEGIQTKIVAPDLASPYFDPEVWVTTLLADSAAASYLSAISYHTYYVDGGPDQWNAKFVRIAALAAAKKLPVYFTEIGTTPWNIPHTSWAWAFDCMQMWHNILSYGNASLGFQWALLGRDYVVNPDATRNPIFFALEQLFQHIPIGAMRIEAQSDHRDLLASAFKHVGKNSAQIVLINRSPSELLVKVYLQNLPLQHGEAYRTSAKEQHVPAASFPVVNQRFQIKIPATAVLTLKGVLAPAEDVIPPKPPINLIIKEQ